MSGKNQNLKSRKRRSSEENISDVKSKLFLRSNLQKFDWENLCFICAQKKNKGNQNLTKVTMESNLKSRILKVAKKDENDLIKRINMVPNLFSVGAKYHHTPCYLKYTPRPSKNLNLSINNDQMDLEENDIQDDSNNDIQKRVFVDRTNTLDDNLNKDSHHLTSAKHVLQFFRDKLLKGEVIRFSDMCSVYITRYSNLTSEKSSKVQSSYIKSYILSVPGHEIVFSSKNGYDDIVYSNKYNRDFFARQLYDNQKKFDRLEKLQRLENQFHLEDDNIILHKAAGLVQKAIASMPPTLYYPIPNDLTLGNSKIFPPIELQKLLSWIISNTAFQNANIIGDWDMTKQKYMLTLCECIIFATTSSNKEKVIPPFHYGLAMLIHHEHGSKSLIEALHSCGFCITYDELRRIVTALAIDQLKKNSLVYVPPEIISRNSGGDLIHEGDDNVDMNTETVDGKNTYHSLAIVIFQNQRNTNINKNTTRLKRQGDKTLEVKDYSNHPILKTFHYKKPNTRPEPPHFVEGRAAVEKILEKIEPYSYQDITWILLRSLSRSCVPNICVTEQFIPNWTAYNTRFSVKKESFTVAQYAPAINESPSDLNTIYTALKRGQELVKACGQVHSIHTFDQQLYSIAQEIKFNIPEETKNSVLILGGFHTAFTFISCINKIWGNCGLNDMLSESQVYAKNTVDRMLEGKHFHRAIRGLTLCYEALLHLMFENFFDWCSSNSQEGLHSVLVELHNFQKKYVANDTSIESASVISHKINKTFMPALSRFREEARKKSKTFSFWDDCLQALQILLQFIRSFRTSDWNLHVANQLAMLPYFFACNKQNYSRWGTFYGLEMLLTLPQKIKEEFLAGKFSVNFTPEAFRGLFTDMATEMSVIKDTKSDTGIMGLTRKEGAILRWVLTRSIVGNYASLIHQRCNRSANNNTYQNYIHEGEKPTSLKRDDNDVCKIIKYIKGHMINPFCDKQCDSLVNISTGLVAPPDIQISLLNAIDKGRKKMYEFIKRIDSDPLEDEIDKNLLEQNTDSSTSSSKKKCKSTFHDAITKYDLKTFAHTHKPALLTINGKKTFKVIKPEIVYQRALALSYKRSDINLLTILSCPITNIPNSLFKEDGSKRYNPKSDLMHVLETKIRKEQIITNLPPSVKINAVVIDAMGLVNSFNKKALKSMTFNDFGYQISKEICMRLKEADEVHLVFDRYDNVSMNPKHLERVRRYGYNNHEFTIHGGRCIDDIDKILSSNPSKSNLTNFIGNYLKDTLPSKDIMKHANKKIYVSGALEPRNSTWVITEKYQFIDFNMKNNHYEADTRIIFHVNLIQSKFKENESKIVVESPDTDVFILLLYHYHSFEQKPNIWFYTGNITRNIDHRRYIHIDILAKILGFISCKCILVLHALTGCDTVSSFFGIGKKTAFAGLCKLTDIEMEDLSKLNSLEIEEALKIVTVLLRKCYDTKSKFKSTENCINSFRYFLATKKIVSIDKLPPSKAALLQHVLRSKWELNEWDQAILADIVQMDVEKSGWRIVDNELVINYFDGQHAMEKLQKYFCNCSGKDPCKTECCTCIDQSLQCCDICDCSENCKNHLIVTEEPEIHMNNELIITPPYDFDL